MKSDDCGRTDRGHHRIDTGEAQPNGQLPGTLPPIKLADVGRCSMTGNVVELSKSQRAPGHPNRSRPEEERGSAFLHGIQETEWCHKERLFPTAPDLRNSGHACWSQMILHSGPEVRLLAAGSASGRQGEDCVFDGSRAMAVQSFPLASATLHRRLSC
jgi:hypothetical protein